jgi:hypothetical protein
MPEGFNSEEKVKILLTEYNSLRAEIGARTGYGFQVGGFAVTALSLLAAQAITWRSIVVFVLILILIVGVMFLVFGHIWITAARVREIERDVNERAGEKLLVWETGWGYAQHWFSDRPRQST